MNLSDYLRVALYYGLARSLPPSSAAGGRHWRRIRAFAGRPLLAGSGPEINIEHGASFGLGKVSLGRRSGLGVDCRLYGPVEIGQNVMMGRDVVIVALNHAFDRCDIPMIDQGHQPPEPVRIEDDVWIGDRALIVPGVTIGRGSIIALGAVVTKDVPPYSIVAGNPARRLRSRRDT